MPLLRRLLFDNWHLKVLSLLLAFLLWATYTAAPPSEVGYRVTLEFRNLPPNLEITGDVPERVYVRARGRSALLRRLSEHDFAVVSDLAGSAPGECILRLTADLVEAPPGVKVVRIQPDQVRFRISERFSVPPPAPR